MERDGFVFYRSFYEALECLDDKEAYECFKAIAIYALDGVEIETSGIVKALFLTIKPQIDANNHRYVNGCKGGRPANNQKITKGKPNENQTITKVEPKEKDKEKDKEKENVKDKEKDKEKESRAKTTVFTPPSFEEVNKYCTERNNGVDPQAFIDFYSSKGWLIGKSKMKDWKAAIRTWERRDRETRLPPIENNKAKIDDFFRRSMGL